MANAQNDERGRSAGLLAYGVARRGRRLMLPMVLLLAGVYLCVGCIPLPSTGQYLVNGNPKPTWSIGTKPDKPVRVGYTDIDTAITFLDTLVAGKDQTTGLMGHGQTSSTEDVKVQWQVSADRRHYALEYSKRSGYLVWPLCFMVWSDRAAEYVVLDVDAAGRVVDYHTVSAGTFRDNWAGMRFDPAFPELVAERERRYEEQMRAYRTTQPAVTPAGER